MTKDDRKSLFTEEEAIELANTGWWKRQDAETIAMFQLQEPLMCMDFCDFQTAFRSLQNIRSLPWPF